MSIIVKIFPLNPSTMSNGESPFVGSFNLKMASGFLKISLGPRKPFIALLIHRIATSVVMAAEAPFESDNYFPALIARNGM